MNDTELWAKSDAARDQHDALLDRHWPKLSDASCQEGLRKVAAFLEDVLESGHRDPTFARARALRFLGDVYGDLGVGGDKEDLAKAATAYVEAEAIHAHLDEPLERAKLAFNYANTLRRIQPQDRWLLQEARRHYELARELFEQQQPELVDRVDEATASLGVLLRVTKLREEVDATAAEVDAIGAMIDEGGDAAVIRQRMSEALRRSGGPSALVRQVRAVVDDLPEHADVVEAKLGHQLDELEQRAAELEPEPGPEAKLVRMLAARLEAEGRSGKVDPDRLEHLRSLVGRLEQKVDPADDVHSLAAARRDIAEMAEQVMPTLESPSHGLPAPPEGSLAARLRTHLAELHTALARDALLPGGMGKTHSLVARASKADEALCRAGGDDARARAIERERLRQIALDVREHLSRRRPMLAVPLWGSSPDSNHPNAISVLGRDFVVEAVKEAAKDLKLKVFTLPRSDDVAPGRWRQLARAAAVVLDFGASAGSDLASVGYEYGIARALGKPVVVLRGDEPLPFDVGVAPVTRRDELPDAIVDALYAVEVDGRSGVKAAVEAATTRYGGERGSTLERQCVAMLPGLEDDPDANSVGSALDALSRSADDRPMLFHPPWALDSHLTAGTLFHVMPFGPDWADAVSAAVEKGTGGRLRYVRGDREPAPDILRDIWEQIVRADAVVVDLTGLNVNVAVELGFCHVLGKPTLLTSRAPLSAGSMFTMISRMRIQPYASPAELEQAVGAFLSSGMARSAAPGDVPPPSGIDTTAVERAIVAAVQHETRTHGVKQALFNASALAGLRPSPQQVQEAVAFIVLYVQSVPSLMHALGSAAAGTPQQQHVHRLLGEALRYWHEPNDFIPDHLGLLGIMDDAYVTLSLLQAVSEQCYQATGRPLLPHDLRGANMQVGQLIGPPVVQQLDGYVARLLGQPQAQDWLTQLFQLAASQPWSAAMHRPMADPIWGNASPSEIANVRLGAMGVV